MGCLPSACTAQSSPWTSVAPSGGAQVCAHASAEEAGDTAGPGDQLGPVLPPPPPVGFER